MKKLALCLVILASSFIFTGCDMDRLLDEVPKLPRMPWQEEVEEYVWGQEVQDLVTPALSTAPVIDTGRMDKAPLASQYVAIFYQAIQTGDYETFLAMQQIPTDLLNGVNYDAWYKLSGYDQYQTFDITQAETISEYTDDLASVTFEWTYKENDQKVKKTFEAQVRMTDQGFSVMPRSDGFYTDHTMVLPGQVLAINGQDFSRYITEQNTSYTTMVFDYFPMGSFGIDYQTRWGHFACTVTPDENGEYFISQTITEERQRQSFVSAANGCINQLWHALWDTRSKEEVMKIFLNEEKVDQLLYQLPDIKNKTVTFVEVQSSLSDQSDLVDYVYAGDIVHLNVKYHTKFDISTNGMPVSMSSCKDFTWMDLQQREDGSWVIVDMGIDGDQSILTYLDYTNNEW